MPEIRLPVFQGPLDLLLHLIERDDLDITAVSLVAVTDQYLTAIHSHDSVDATALAEFVSIGAKLIYLKSRALLPVADTEDESDLEDDDVGRELVELLMEYQRFSAVADMLDERQSSGMRLFGRDVPPPSIPPGTGLEGVGIEALYAVMMEVLSRKPEEPTAVVTRQTLTLAERIEDFRTRLRRSRRFSFRKALESCQTRIEVVICFMAILELLKSGDCDAVQEERFGDIQVVALTPSVR